MIKNKDGTLIRKGNFETGRPVITTIYKIIDKSRILKILGISIPPRIGNSDIKLASEAIQQMKIAFNEKYPNGEFYALIYPGSIFAKEIIAHLNRLGVRYLNYSHLFIRNDPNYCLAREDLHPSALAYKTIAQTIVKDLRLNE